MSQDLGSIFAKAQEMQSRLTQLQQELSRRTVEAQAGGGMVRVVASGDLRVQSVQIEPSLIAEDDREMLQDLVTAAVNAALAEAQRMVQSEMQKVAGIPGLADLKGLMGGGS